MAILSLSAFVIRSPSSGVPASAIMDNTPFMSASSIPETADVTQSLSLWWSRAVSSSVTHALTVVDALTAWLPTATTGLFAAQCNNYANEQFFFDPVAQRYWTTSADGTQQLVDDLHVGDCRVCGIGACPSTAQSPSVRVNSGAPQVTVGTAADPAVTASLMQLLGATAGGSLATGTSGDAHGVAPLGLAHVSHDQPLRLLTDTLISSPQALPALFPMLAAKESQV
jgi:hypothetical protein